MKLMTLPEEVKEVEGCPLTWFWLEFDSFEDVETLHEHFQYLLKKPSSGGDRVQQLEGREEDLHNEEVGGWEDKEEEICHLPVPKEKSFSRQLNRIVMMTFLGDYEGAVKMLANLRVALGGLSGEDEHSSLKTVGEYVVETLEWSISRMQQGRSSSESGPSSVPGTDANKLVEFGERFKVLEGDAKARVMILYLKGRFRNLIPGRREEYVKTLLEITNLESDNHVWHVYAFKAVRKDRRKFQEGSYPTKAPTQQEIALYETAYKLESNRWTTANLAMMLKDCLWMTVYGRSFPFNKEIEPCPLDHSETLKRCLDLCDQVIRLREESKRNDLVLSLRCRVYKADILCNLGADHVARSEGLNMFLKLIEEYPDNAEYRHKLGKIFQYGVIDDSGHKFLRNIPAALEQFTMALELHQRNYYSCLVDYVKLFKILHPPLPAKEALGYLTASLARSDLIRGKVLEARLRMWRGAVLWIYNPEEKAQEVNKREACGEWLRVLEDYPVLQEMLLKFIWKLPFKVHERGRSSYAEICTEELKNVLEKIKEEKGVSAKTLGAVEVILEEIERNSQLSRLMATVKMFQDNDNYVTYPNSEENLVPWKMKRNRDNGSGSPQEEKRYVPPHGRGGRGGGGRKPRTDSLADKDDNWRASK